MSKGMDLIKAGAVDTQKIPQEFAKGISGVGATVTVPAAAGAKTPAATSAAPTSGEASLKFGSLTTVSYSDAISSFTPNASPAAEASTASQEAPASKSYSYSVPGGAARSRLLQTVGQKPTSPFLTYPSKNIRGAKVATPKTPTLPTKAAPLALDMSDEPEFSGHRPQ